MPREHEGDHGNRWSAEVTEHSDALDFSKSMSSSWTTPSILQRR